MKSSAVQRILILCIIAAALFTGFSLRLIHIQVLKHDQYASMAARKHSHRQVIHARRGLIYDRHGELLASNLPVRTITADGTHIQDPAAVARVVAPILEIPEAELTEKLTTDRRYVVIERGVPEEVYWALVEALQANKLRGIYSEPDAVRIYPHGQVLGPVLGFLDHEGNGIQGVEKTLEDRLRGRDGYRYIERDRKGREILLYRGQEEPAENGQNVVLTIDMGLQAIVEEELERVYQEVTPTGAVAIVMDPSNGEVLAMANRPTFDPNRYREAPPEAMKNLCISAQVEPGSTFKIVVASAALNERVVNDKSSIYCEGGRFFYGGRILKDHHGYGHMSVHDILVKSSNIGSAKMALMLGEQKFYDYVRRFGFGERSGIELPGEIPGTVHPPSRWDKLTITRMPMGHALAVTPIQIANAMSVIANGGKLNQPTVVQKFTGPGGLAIEGTAAAPAREVVPEKVAAFVKNALAGVCEPGGTATLARVPGFAVAGKTGTAQRVSPRGGYAPGEYVVSFVGFLPVEEPRFVCLVMVDNAKLGGGQNYGGLVAAPVFSRIGEKVARYLNLMPTMAAEPVTALNTRHAPAREEEEQ